MIWISRDALTRGVYEIDARIVEEGTGKGMAYTNPKDRYTPGEMFYAGEWHRTREEAVQAAEEMRKCQVHSLMRKIALLQGLTF